MYPAAISLLSFTRREVVMQENSCIKRSSIFLAGFDQAFMYSLRVLGHKHNVNFKVSSTCFNVDKKTLGESRGSSVMKSGKLTKPCKVF